MVFLDEFPEFCLHVLAALRQPIEQKSTRIKSPAPLPPHCSGHRGSPVPGSYQLKATRCWARCILPSLQLDRKVGKDHDIADNKPFASTMIARCQGIGGP